MMKTNTLTPKEQIRVLVERMPDDMTLDQLLYKLELFIAVFTGVQQLERGEGIDHDKLFDELLREDNEEEKNNLVRSSRKRPPPDKKSHSPGLAKNGSKVHKATKGIRK